VTGTLSWRPGISRDRLAELSQWLLAIRQHFNESGACEVITPVLSAAGNLDPAITSMTTSTPAGLRYLHTSPEYAMKRLLAAGSGDIYQLCRVFRADEQGSVHNTEFTMLEWYREGVDHEALILEVDGLFTKLWDGARRASGRSLPPTERVSYVDLMATGCRSAFDEITTRDIADALEREAVALPESIDPEDSGELGSLFDLYFSTVVSTAFKRDRFTCVQDYPASQAALAKVNLNANGQRIAERFEFFFGELELANGYHELQSAAEHHKRFEQDIAVRRTSGAEVPPTDDRFLAAIESGLPACAGVAVGVERLFMVLSGEQDIAGVMTFASDCA